MMLLLGWLAWAVAITGLLLYIAMQPEREIDPGLGRWKR